MNMTEHDRKYDALSHWLGIGALCALVPTSADRIAQALAHGDEHLNTIPLHLWDRAHGLAPNEQPPRGVTCPHCKQAMPCIPVKTLEFGVWGLVRQAIRRDRAAGRVPLRTSWSLSDTVCTLKHVTTFYVAKGARQDV